MQDISKHYSLQLDIKKSKTLILKDLIVNVGDDVTLTIDILDNNEPKDLTGCTIDLIIQNENTELLPIKHDFKQGGITINENQVVIICENNYIDMVGRNTVQLFITDLDQSISTQKFMYTTITTLSSDILNSASNQIDTLVKLDKVIDEAEAKLTELDKNNTELTNKINTNLIELTDRVDTEIEKADIRINNHIEEVDNNVTEFENSINDRIDTINEIVDYELIKINKLTPATLSGLNTIGFESKVIDIPAIDLVRSAFDFCVSGSPSSTQIIQAATGHIVFYVEVVNSKQVVKARLSAMIDQSIQGKQLLPTIHFIKNGILVDTLDIADIDYKIIVRANIHMNNIHTGECCLSSLGRSIKL